MNEALAIILFFFSSFHPPLFFVIPYAPPPHPAQCIYGFSAQSHNSNEGNIYFYFSIFFLFSVLF